MLVRLTKAGRIKAGRLLALVYMFCVLTPSLAFAFSDGPLAAPCLTENEQGFGIFQVHEERAVHSHLDGHAHHHADVAVSSLSDAREHFVTGSAPNGTGPAEHHQKSGGTCCGMVCVTALPAFIIDLSVPSAPASRCAAETYRRLADDPLPTPYRPPNS